METKSIFENSKLGDKFRIRDGRMAIYVREARFDYYFLLVESEVTARIYEPDGRAHYTDRGLDIYCKWQEPIDEEELTKIAECWNINTALYPTIYDRNYTDEDIVEAFKLGYRKAIKGEII